MPFQGDIQFTALEADDDILPLVLDVDLRNRSVWLTDTENNAIEIAFGEFDHLLAAVQRVAAFINR